LEGCRGGRSERGEAGEMGGREYGGEGGEMGGGGVGWQQLSTLHFISQIIKDDYRLPF
jgi:hypothetical protein